MQIDLFAQDVISQKSGYQDNSGNENNHFDRTEIKTKYNSKGEPIELYDLIHLLLPDEGETGEVIGWEKLDEISNIILGNKNYYEFDKSYSKNGEVIITINGKSFKNDREGDNEWDINFEWNKDGWSIFDLYYVYNHSVDFDQDFYYDLYNLFPSINFESKLIFKEDKWNQSIYEVKFIGKRLCYMRITHEGNKIPTFGLRFYLNEKEIDTNNIY